MEIINGICNIMITIAILVAIVIGVCKFENAYSKAMTYRDLGKAELALMYTVDREHYNDLKENYEFMVSIPLIGETL